MPFPPSECVRRVSSSRRPEDSCQGAGDNLRVRLVHEDLISSPVLGDLDAVREGLEIDDLVKRDRYGSLAPIEE